VIARASTIGQLVTALLHFPLSTPIGDVQVLDGRESSGEPMRLRIAGDVDPEAAVREALRRARDAIDDSEVVALNDDVPAILDAVRQRT